MSISARAGNNSRKVIEKGMRRAPGILTHTLDAYLRSRWTLL